MDALGKELAGIIKFFKWCVIAYFGFMALMIVGAITSSWIDYFSRQAQHVQSLSAPVDDRGIVTYGQR